MENGTAGNYKDEKPTYHPSAQPPAQQSADALKDFASERYRFILQQISASNENTYRFLAIYQTLMTALVTAQIGLFVWHKRLGLTAHVSRVGLVSILLLETIVASFTILMIVIGIFTWLDYRNEECDLTDEVIYVGFRARPKKWNFLRWHETYIVLFVVVTIGLIWVLSLIWMLPNLH